MYGMVMLYEEQRVFFTFECTILFSCMIIQEWNTTKSAVLTYEKWHKLIYMCSCSTDHGKGNIDQAIVS